MEERACFWCSKSAEGLELGAELAMHLYRKFHAKGGVRRVYATADKNWVLCRTTCF